MPGEALLPHLEFSQQLPELAGTVAISLALPRAIHFGLNLQSPRVKATQRCFEVGVMHEQQLGAEKKSKLSIMFSRLTRSDVQGTQQHLELSLHSSSLSHTVSSRLPPIATDSLLSGSRPRPLLQSL